jgi:hypothetical protein
MKPDVVVVGSYVQDLTWDCAAFPQPGETVIGTGLTRNKKQQMEALSYNAVKKVEQWILDNPEWVGLPPKDAEVVPQGRPVGGR